MSRNLLSQSHIVQFAPLECFASSIVTFMNWSGKSKQIFMLNYWGLTYYKEHRALSSSKHFRQLYLEELYGLILNKHFGREEFYRMACEGNVLLVPCTASKLPHFTESMIFNELPGSFHCILVDNYCITSDKFHIIDPVANFIGEVQAQILIDSIIDMGDYSFASFEWKETLDGKAFIETALLAANKNLRDYSKNELDSEANAIDCLLNDLDKSLSWTTDQVQKWVYIQNIGISSIIKMRNMYRENAIEFFEKYGHPINEVSRLTEKIIAAWSSINFQLFRFAHRYNNNNNDNMQNVKLLKIKLKELYEQEKQFLMLMVEKINKL